MLRAFIHTALALSAMASVAYANPAHDKVMQLAEPERKSIFATLLQRSGELCTTARRTFYEGSDAQGNAFWAVDRRDRAVRDCESHNTL